MLIIIGICIIIAIYYFIEYINNNNNYTDESFNKRIISPFIDQIRNIFKYITPTSKIKRLNKKSIALNMKIDGIIFFALQVSIFIIIFIISFLFFNNWFVSIILAFITYYIPEIIINYLIKIRNLNILLELPNLLDFIIIYIEAGLGFDSALTEILNEMHGPLYEEFNKTANEIRHGLDRKIAFLNMTKRVNVPQLNKVVNSLLQADEFGVPIKDMLDMQSRKLKIERKQRAENEINKAPTKISVVLAIFILPVILVLILGVSIINLFHIFE